MRTSEIVRLSKSLGSISSIVLRTFQGPALLLRQLIPAQGDRKNHDDCEEGESGVDIVEHKIAVRRDCWDVIDRQDARVVISLPLLIILRSCSGEFIDHTSVHRITSRFVVSA
jgi:hypothetical protein